jgi:uncharacterized protein (DUF1778 family)
MSAGRRKKATAGAMANVLRIRMRQEERDLLDAAAKVRSLETSSWARSELVRLARAIVDEEAARKSRE